MLIAVPTSRTDTMPSLVSQMLEPNFYGHAPEAVELRETNTSWVFLAGPLVYKVKRGVRFPFLDYSTIERRLAMCRAEVELNRELAPDTYLGVRSIVSADGRLALGAEDDPEAVEYAVEMRRLPEERSMAHLAKAGDLRPADVEAVGRRVACFHARTARASPGARQLERLIEGVHQNLAALRSAGSQLFPPDRLRAAEAFTDAFLSRRMADLVRRSASGLVRHCHGDLRAEHVVLTNPIVIFDRLEFDPGHRWIDVAAEVAFLTMDLEACGARWASDRLVDAYRDAGGDPGDDSLIAFFGSYRAWIRSLVACLRADSGSRLARTGARREAMQLFALGHRLAWRARLPLALGIAGIAGSGKTTLAREITRISGLPDLSSDETRKGLAGLAPTERAAPEHYSDAFSRRTYRQLGERSAAAIREHGGAIIDATFLRAADRDAFRAGFGDPASPMVFIQCAAPRDELLRRVRARGPGTVSDADQAVVERQLAEHPPAPGSASSRLQVLTDRPIADVVLDVECFLDSLEPAAGETR